MQISKGNYRESEYSTMSHDTSIAAWRVWFSCFSVARVARGSLTLYYNGYTGFARAINAELLRAERRRLNKAVFSRIYSIAAHLISVI